MGYTHYFKFSKIHGQSKEIELLYQRAIKDCQRVIKHYYAKHGGLSGYSAHTSIGAYGGIMVNGKGSDAHEDFVLREHFTQNEDFNFCKTDRKPYDIVVIACLSILKHRLGDAITVSSDGRPKDWESGIRLARKVTRLAIQNSIGDRAKIA